MTKELLYNLRYTDNIDYPSWTSFPQEFWETILNDFLYVHANSFGFINVLETDNLKPSGLKYFEEWKLENLGLVEFDNIIICRFSLNEDCKNRLLLNEFSQHWTEEKYYEFDELYFFSNDILIGTFIKHEDIIQFKNLNFIETKTLDSLDEKVRKHIYDRDELLIEIKKRKEKNSG